MSTRLAFEFLILTASRSGEVRLSTWDEIDLNAALWTVPAERMKARVEHAVPLAPRAVAILREAHATYHESKFVFPGTKPGLPLSDMTLTKVLRDAGRPPAGETTWPCPYTTIFRIRSALSESIARCKFICDICATRADGRKRLISA